MNLSSEQKRLLRWVGFPLLILVTFVFAAFYTFPYERLGDWIEGQAAKKNWVLSIGDISPRFFPGNVTLSDIEVRTIPCLLYTSPSPRDRQKSRMPSSA